MFSLVSIPSDDQRYFLLGEKCGVGVGGKSMPACLENRILSACFFFSLPKSHNKLLHKHNPRWNRGKKARFGIRDPSTCQTIISIAFLLERRIGKVLMKYKY